MTTQVEDDTSKHTFKSTKARVECWYIDCPYCEADFGVAPSHIPEDERFNENGNFVCPECGKTSRYEGIEV